LKNTDAVTPSSS